MKMGIAGRIAQQFIDTPITALLALLALLLGGFALLVTPKEEEPQINVTMAQIMIPFPGASARDVETAPKMPRNSAWPPVSRRGTATTSVRVPSARL